MKIWRLATIIQVSSLHACVDDFYPPGTGDATILLILTYIFRLSEHSSSGSATMRLPGTKLCHWPFFLNGNSAREFKALQLIELEAFGVVD